MPHASYFALYVVLCILRFLPHAVCFTIYFIFHTVYSVLSIACIGHAVRCTLCTVCTLRYARCALCFTLYTLYCTLRSVYSVLCTLYVVLYTLYAILCDVYVCRRATMRPSANFCRAPRQESQRFLSAGGDSKPSRYGRCSPAVGICWSSR